MPLNYSKWDQLELSDDSDIEGHPNVDKRSLIRWKQRDIHEKREARKHKIASLRAQIDCNSILLPRIREIYGNINSSSSSTDPTTYFNNLVEQLKANPSKDCPPGNDSSKIEHTYDGMILNLLEQVSAKSKQEVQDSSILESEKSERLGKALVEGMKFHCEELKKTIDRDQAELDAEIKEQSKHITSEDLHDGFSSTYIPPKPSPPPLPTKQVESSKGKETVTEIETLNAETPDTPATTPPAAVFAGSEDSLPELTPTLEAFSKLPLWDYESAFKFIQQHRDVVVPGASDALLVSAFNAQSNGHTRYAKLCVHHSLLLQYCEKLGPDGVQIFFRKMISGDKRAEKVFVDDVDNTYAHLVSRVDKSKREIAAGGKEQIQLVPETEGQDINFNVPSGPPPEKIILEGPGTEDMDVEEVRKALQFRWDVFTSFPREMQLAIEDNSLDKVNRCLAEMEVEEAEDIVERLDMAGILSFAPGGTRSATDQEEDEKAEKDRQREEEKREEEEKVEKPAEA